MRVALADASSIIFVHGLRGHPQHTWEDKRGRGILNRANNDAGTVTSRKRDILTALFKSKQSSLALSSTTTSIADKQAIEKSPNKLF